ncbi:MAG: aminodeoxychorismate synthase component I [Thermoanaerobaculia bacterium]|nr:aminodeoxychorismate synthase component I [Thermoanaerobaculia bacterium]
MSEPQTSESRASEPEELAARRRSEVEDVLDRLEAAARDGARFRGWLTYDALEPDFEGAREIEGALPRVWFRRQDPTGSSESRDGSTEEGPRRSPESFELSFPELSVARADYRRSIRAIHDAIERGDTYQVNFTVRARSDFRGDPRGLHGTLLRIQPVPYAAYLELDRWAICSLSPELFFRIEGDRIVCKPMKGTARRGRWPGEDRNLAEALRTSEKERAENLMIVDMVRNDLGKIARPGTVEVIRLFELERYATVWQMTSTVEARTDASLREILRALFPPASVTGAPKRRTMELIRELEDSPRGLYCGAVGTVGPGRRAELNVAIRTAVVDREAEELVYGVGSGVVWDSDPDAEYDEVLAKTRVLVEDRPEFELLETILWRPDRGLWLWPEHEERLRASADYFGFPSPPEDLRRRVEELGETLSPGFHRVRLLWSEEGTLRLGSRPLEAPGPEDPEPAFPARGSSEGPPIPVTLARDAIDPDDRFLFHKTTHRMVYERARRTAPEGVEDVILWNPAGFVTETTIANLVVEIEGTRRTPPLEHGLLPGILRARLLAEGAIVEAPVSLEEIPKASGIWRINSVRGWQPCRVVPAGNGKTASRDRWS